MELPADLTSRPIDRELIELLKKKVDFYIRSDAGQALELADLAVRLSHDIADPLASAIALRSKASASYSTGQYSQGIALASFNAANIHSNLHNFASARDGYQLAERLYSEQGMGLAAAQARYSLGYLDFLTGNYHRSMRVLFQVKPEFERLSDARTAAVCLLDLSEICLQMNV